MERTISYIILGEPASKANSRRLVRFGKRVASIKSDKARAYVDAVIAQVPVLNPLMEGELRVDCTIYYASERPDLDPSCLWDALQGRVYKNDRQLREQHLYHQIDRERPRAEVTFTERRGAPVEGGGPPGRKRSRNRDVA
jgi:Holliday junction resolvase RusA-like endonuclease